MEGDQPLVLYYIPVLRNNYPLFYQQEYLLLSDFEVFEKKDKAGGDSNDTICFVIYDC